MKRPRVLIEEWLPAAAIGVECMRERGSASALAPHTYLHEAHRRAASLWKADIRVIDPMAGGGSIPLEAARLGFSAFANEYNPVACSVLEATVDYPFRLGEQLGRKARRWGGELRKRFNSKRAVAEPMVDKKKGTWGIRFLKDSVDDRVYTLLRQRCGLFEHFVGTMQLVLAAAKDIQWDDALRCEAGAYAENLTDSQRKARLMGKELDAALQDPRWGAAERVVSAP